jgi:hypothetical protein
MYVIMGGNIEEVKSSTVTTLGTPCANDGDC